MATSANTQPTLPARVQQSERHDDVLACLAMLAGNTLEALRAVAENHGMPKIGPFHSHISDEAFIARVLGSFGLVSTNWKAADSFTALPAVAIAGVDADLDYETCRCVLFCRMPATKDAPEQQFVIDPYPHADSKLHVRSDLSNLAVSWYIGVHQMPSASKTKVK